MGISMQILGVPGLFGGVAVNWILLDRFSANLAAGNVDGSFPDPGPGVRNTDETDGEFSTSSGVLNIPAQTTPVWGDLGLWYTPALTRAGGLMFTALLNVATWEEFGLCLHTAAAAVDPDSAEAAVQFNATDGQLDDETGEQIYNGLSTSTDYALRLILRSTGHFIMLDNALIRIVRAGATATLYALLSNLDAVLTADNVGNVQLPIIDPLLFPIPTVSDTFSDTTPPLVSDGLAHVEANGDGAGVTWTGPGTFTNLGNKAYIDADAALGVELISNSDFSAWTGDDPDGWTVIGEVGADPEVCEVATGEAHGDCGTPGGGKANMYSTVALLTLRQNALVANEFYKTASDVDTATSGEIAVKIGSIAALTLTATGSRSATRRTDTIKLDVRGVPCNITIASISAKALAFAELLRAVADNGQPYAAVAMTITANTQAGVMINLDSVTTPQNGIRVWYDLVDAKIYAQELIGGAWQADSLAGVAATYGAGDILEVRRIGNSVYVFYDGAYVGNFTASSSTANTLTALFATDNASYFETLESFPAASYDYGAYA